MDVDFHYLEKIFKEKASWGIAKSIVRNRKNSTYIPTCSIDCLSEIDFTRTSEELKKLEIPHSLKEDKKGNFLNRRIVITSNYTLFRLFSLVSIDNNIRMEIVKEWVSTRIEKYKTNKKARYTAFEIKLYNRIMAIEKSNKVIPAREFKTKRIN